VAASKTSAEQILVEPVKRIASEVPEENVIVSDGGNAKMPAEVTSSRDSWREVAQKLEHESDPRRVIELAEQLIAALDEEQLCKRLPRKDAEIR
jgi:hypothetical protein